MIATIEGSASPVIIRKIRMVWPLLVMRSICRSAWVTQTTPVSTTRPERKVEVAVLNK